MDQSSKVTVIKMFLKKKKPSLDPSVFANFRATLNLSFISKILEKGDANQQC